MRQKLKQNQQNCSAKKKINKDKITSPVHKQFQFMYRTCDRLPSSQQYQSVIFMKHHKISPQSNLQKQIKRQKRQKGQGNKKSKEYKSSQMNKNKDYDKEHKMAVTKSTAPFSTCNGDFQQSIYPPQQKEKTKQRKEAKEFKEFKQKEQKPSKESKIGNLKNLKIIHEKKVKDSKRPGTGRQKQYKIDKRNQSSKRQNKNKLDDSNEFIVIENSFLEIGKISLENLQHKLVTANQYKKEEENQFLNSIHRESTKKQVSTFKLEGDSYIPQKVELETVKKYINEKVIIIQRWWRKMKETKLKCHYQTQNQIEFEMSERKNYEEQSVKEIFDSQDNEEMVRKLVNLRQITALNHMKSQKTVLNQLFEKQKITGIIYADKTSQIELQFQNQMFKISKLKQILVQNTQRIKHLQEKIKSETEITKNINCMSPQEIAERLFSPQSSEFNEQQFVLSGGPLFESTNYNRKKATGCHFASSPEQIASNIYSKHPQEIREEFESENENESSEEEMGLKIEENNMCELLEYYNDRQKAQNEIEKRHAIQIGMVVNEEKDQTAISTSVVAVHSFLSNFLKFYSYFYKDEFLKMINMPFGLNPRRRLCQLQGYELDEENQDFEDGIIYGISHVIGQQILQDFHEHHYQESSDNLEVRKKISYEKCHHKAIIDAFNETLNCFRPYYYINGPPYSWSNSEKALTFYFVAQENIQQVFDKTQYKVLKWCSSLCGVISDCLSTQPTLTEQMTLHEKLIEYRNSVNCVLAETRQQKLGKSQKQEMERKNYEWFLFQQNQTNILLQVSALIFEELVEQCQGDFLQK